MFERYWKPHFDNWASQTNQTLERFVQSPLFLRTAAGALGVWMKSLSSFAQMRDQISVLLGVAMRANQHKMMYALQRLLAQVEDLAADLRDAQKKQTHEVRTLHAMMEALSQEVARLQEQLSSPRAAEDAEMTATRQHTKRASTRQDGV